MTATPDVDHVYIGQDALPNLEQYCAGQHLDRFMLVADKNTYPVLGQAVEQHLKNRGRDVKTVILAGDEIIADEHYLVQVWAQADNTKRTYLAVGSGTITDITRFVSHRSRTTFISIPTAPSVDGFTSVGAPLVVAGLKQTVLAQAPTALFADVTTLCQAPRPMIASGFCDVAGKYVSLADWKLGALLWDEPYDQAAARQVEQALDNCARHTGPINQAQPKGIELLMDALIQCGLAMLKVGSSRPASGSEHHISHHFEMKLAWEKKPAVLHGAKVGIGCLTMAGYYEKIRTLSQQQAAERLAATPQPDRAAEIQRIKAVYGPIADQLIAAQAPFLEMSQADYRQLQQHILDHWPQVQQIAATVPPPQEIAALLQHVGAATDIEALGLSRAELERATHHSHYLRNRFTVAKLSRLLGILPPNQDN